jgi:formylglycine-generating enzyme required for sulfatase activity
MRWLYLVILTTCATVLCVAPASANNLALTNVTLASQNTGAQTYQIQFDTSWNNSWYISGAPSSTANWDAVWVFAKFRKYSGGAWGNWAHCTLNNSGNTAATGSQMAFGGIPYGETAGGIPNSTITAYKGVFIYASGAETGSVSYTGNQIQWAYGTDGVGNTDKVEIRVFGVEMVYIPGYDSSLSESGFNFYVGDPGDTVTCPFYQGDNSANAYQITAESAITVGTSSGNLYYDSGANCGDRGTPIPAAFPKGYNAYYIMKYDITQREYAEFLNTLTATQQTNRWATGNFNSNRYYIKKASNGLFGVDDGNVAGSDGSANYALMNGSSSGGWVTCNWLSWMDVAAYGAWAALRPATEFEIEKASRGPNAAVAGEYAWGNTTITQTSAVTNGGQASEVPSAGNCNYNNGLGPVRAGSYATASSTRQVAGAGYYGAMELSGNLWKRDVTVGNSTGRAFIGTHGSGTLDASGNATNSDWPGYSSPDVSGATGSGFLGGDWANPTSDAPVAGRTYAADTFASRSSSVGGRLARASP